MATRWAVSMAMEKHKPWADWIVAVLTPTTSPREFTKGPPELPVFKAASGLDHIVDQPAGAGPKGPAQRADNAGRHGGLKSQGASDGHHQLSDPKASGGAQDRRG